MSKFILVGLSILIAMFVVNNCGSPAQQLTNAPEPAKPTANAAPWQGGSYCEYLSGSWGVYVGRAGVGEKTCKGGPCGARFPNIKLKCEEGRLTGTSLRGVDSTVSPPKTYLHEISVRSEGGFIILEYLDSLSCERTYRLSKFEENRLAGTWSAINCRTKLMPYYEGDVVLIRSEPK